MDKELAESLPALCLLAPFAVAILGLVLSRLKKNQPGSSIYNPPGDSRIVNLWELRSDLAGPTIRRKGTNIEVPIEPGGMVEEAQKMGARITGYGLDLSKHRN